MNDVRQPAQMRKRFPTRNYGEHAGRDVPRSEFTDVMAYMRIRQLMTHGYLVRVRRAFSVATDSARGASLRCARAFSTRN